MIDVMSDKIRLVVVVADEVRAAVRLEAAKLDIEMSELVEGILRKALAESLAEVRERKAKADKKGGKQP